MAYKVVVSDAAIRLADSIDEIYDSLQRHPEIFSLSLDKRLAENGYRRAVVQNYILLYRVDEKTEQVLIARFFYGRREYEKYI